MTAPTEIDIAGRLDALRNDARLPEAVRTRAASFRQRLVAPVRVAVAGPAGSGKSTLIRLLAGHGETCAPPPAEIRSRRFANLVLFEYPMPPANSGEGPVALADGAPDIVLWCSQRFDAAEREFWSQVPDPLKDRSFLVLTKADELIGTGLLQQRLTDLQAVVIDEFHSLLPIATSQALAATGTDPAEHAASGARALCTTLRRMVAQGRGAALDAATLFLRAHETARPVPAADPTGGVALAAANEALPMTQADARPAPAMAPVTDAGTEAATLSRRALAVLDHRAADFPAELGDEENGIAALLDLCTQTADALHALVNEHETVPDDLTEDVLEAAEMMVLLALEDDEAAAADAVTLLLQLRRGFETRLAA